MYHSLYTNAIGHLYPKSTIRLKLKTTFQYKVTETPVNIAQNVIYISLTERGVLNREREGEGGEDYYKI